MVGGEEAHSSSLQMFERLPERRQNNLSALPWKG